MSGNATKLRVVFASCLAVALTVVAGPVPASAHLGEDHAAQPPAEPGVPEVRRVGETTYRYMPAQRAYEVRRPGLPPGLVHLDQARRTNDGEPAAAGPAVALPWNELAPVCRTSGNRVVVVYSRRPGGTPPPVASLQSITRRITWKLADQSSQSSGGSRVARLAVDCNAAGAINVHTIDTVNNDFPTIEQATRAQLYGDPFGDEAVKYLVFDERASENHPTVGVGGPVYPDAKKSHSNTHASRTLTAVIYSPVGESHVAVHELLHAFGATQGREQDPPPPFTAGGAHCTDGLDVLCYNDGYGIYTETRCPESQGYGQPASVPVDCGNDTYFDALPTPGTWLAQYWNVAGPENWFMVVPPQAAIKPASQIGSTKATLRGTAIPEGTKATYRFEYWPVAESSNKTLTASASVPNPYEHPTDVSTPVANLTPETPYRFRILVTSVDGQSAVSGEETFTTMPPPSAVTEDATGVEQTKATLRGTVNPRGLTTSYRFDYGPTAAYGSSVPIPNKFIGFGTTDVAVSQTLEDLIPAKSYHYRVVATNGELTTFGEDRIFTTKGFPPVFSSSFGSVGSANGQLKTPQGVTTDAQGNVWVADSENHRLQKFSPQGQYLSQFGSLGSANGQLNTPSDIAVTASGDLWVVDKGNDRIQKFSAQGAYLGQFGGLGSGQGQFNDPWGIAIGPNGTIWVSDRANNRIQQFTASGTFIRSVGNSGSGNGQFSGPVGIAVDPSNNVWVVDRVNNRVQQFSSTGQYLSQFGSKGSADGQFEGPRAIEVAPSGNLVVTDRWLNRVQVISPHGVPVAVFGTGQVSGPEGIAIGSDGVIYLSSASGDRIEKWVPQPASATTGTASAVTDKSATVSGAVNPNGTATSYRFEYGTTLAYGASAPVPDQGVGSGGEPVSVSAPLTNLQSETAYHYRLVATNAGGVTYGKDATFKTNAIGSAFASAFGSLGSGNGQFKRPQGVTIGFGGTVMVADSENHRIQVFNQQGEYLRQFGTLGSGNGQMNTPSDMALAPNGDVWVVDKGNNRIQRFTSEGQYVTQFGSKGSGQGQFNDPWGIARGLDGTIWVSDRANNRIQQFTASGAFIRSVGNSGSGNGQFSGPMGIAVDPSNNVWVVDRANYRVQKFSSTGQYLSQFGSKGSADGQFEGPRAIEVAPSGNLLVTDRWRGLVQEFSPAGEFLVGFGGQIGEPEGIAIANTMTFVSAAQANRIERWVKK
jgi:tripartite motif-containing protein 71